MQAFKKTKSREPLIIVCAFILVGIIAGIFGFLGMRSQNNLVDNTPLRPANTVDYGPLTQEQQQAAETNKEGILQKNEEQNSTGTPISVSIVRADQASAGQPLNIRAQINGATSGNCDVTLSRSGQPTINKSFLVVFEATSSRCQSADIPITDFTEAGEWQLRLVVRADSAESEPVEQNVDIAK